MLAFSPGGTATPVAPAGGPQFEPLGYGTGTAPDIGGFDRSYDIRLDDGLGFSQAGSASSTA